MISIVISLRFFFLDYLGDDLLGDNDDLLGDNDDILEDNDDLLEDNCLGNLIST